ncbi:MAG: methyl-accepting chemotaxis protein [Gammaproteobacteria bacterium]|nr:methyl-accepting chemotaxis protein [Gammaproteobacteria bacterium]
MAAINKFFATLSISHKLWAGFAIVLTILAVVVGNTLFSLAKIKDQASTVTEEVQPTLIASMALMTELKEAAAYLGFFLLTKEDSHKTSYHTHLAGIDEKLQTLKDTPVARDSVETQATLAEIEQRVARFKAYEARMIQLTEVQTENFAALGYASTDLNPISAVIVQHLSDMILSEAEEEASEERKLLYTDIQELRYTWTNVLNNVRIFLMFGDPAVLSNIRLFHEGTVALIEKIAGYDDMLTFEQEVAITELRKSVASYGEKTNTLAEIHKGAKARTDAFLLRTEIGPLLAEIDGLLNELVERQHRNIEITSASLIEQTESTTSIVTSLLFIGLLVGGGIAWITTQLISKPLSQAVTAMRNIAEGEGDLTQRLQSRGDDEVAQLAKAFNQFAANIQELLGQVLDSADQISSSSQEMAAASSNAESSILKQNAETEQISTAVEEMSMNAQEVAQNAELAADAARNADEETTEGRRIVTNALQSVGDLADETQAAADVIEKLGKDIQGISSVIDVIRGVAEQTNLLALNAAIEAARAGEQGRGFAVVADEVRTLASRTQQSTQEIQDKVVTLQQDAENAVTKMLHNREIADNTIQLTSTAGTSLEAITQAVARITEMSDHIARAAEQQSEVANVVSQNIANVAQLAKTTENASQHVFLGTKGLNQLAVALRERISRFKV